MYRCRHFIGLIFRPNRMCHSNVATFPIYSFCLAVIIIFIAYIQTGIHTNTHLWQYNAIHSVNWMYMCIHSHAQFESFLLHIWKQLRSIWKKIILRFAKNVNFSQALPIGWSVEKRLTALYMKALNAYIPILETWDANLTLRNLENVLKIYQILAVFEVTHLKYSREI